MAHWFDDVALSVATETPRRTALRRVGAGLAGAVALLVLGGSRAAADDDRDDDDDVSSCHSDGLVRCSSKCVVVSIDPDNCGNCGVVCAPGQVCRQGVCQCPPSCTTTQCQPPSFACGMGCCASGQTCSNGTCQTTCPMGQTNCNGTCVNLSSDSQHCGSCSTPGAVGRIFVKGMCQRGEPPRA